MTSFAPLTDLALRQLRNAPAGSFAALTPTEKHDLDQARRMSAAARLAQLNAILQLLGALGIPRPSFEPIRVRGEFKL